MSSSSSCRRSARQVAKGGDAAVVESVKAASDVYAPVSGEVVGVNKELEGDPALVNREAEGGGMVLEDRLEVRPRPRRA